MREIMANEYLDKGCVHYAVLCTTKSGKHRVVGIYGNEALAQNLINALIDFCGKETEDIYEIVKLVPERAGTPEPYTYDDVMQAVCAAMVFAEDIGSEAKARMNLAMTSNETLDESVELRAGVWKQVIVSPLAAQLLATAYNEIPMRCIGTPHEGGYTAYDLRAP